MNTWIRKILANAGEPDGGSPGRAQTMPASSEMRKDEPKRRSFFTLGKKK